ncbi:unnamed protein product [Darwinula stevensoni]|uniref:HEAT repeat-containing protein 1 n=1 Tax=Darwinula stevensoni TaxID=69355 RepID=A0A7R8XAX5_9CRUS|nr:unnamed protein product [Darwinula stevensoni]CAG0890703.1 unnamed protein product [Darwinula stevensoni]
MMATSLAQQLKRLAVPQTSLLSRDLRKASFLFDPNEAAALDRDVIFAIGVSGFEELVGLNPAFRGFEATLFNEASKTFQRAVQTSEDNKKLDKIINDFLLLLSPYFLLKPAHKALEWLVHRFYIHEFNKDGLLACILPYHDTRLFVRAVQMIRLEGQWAWLSPLGREGIPLSKQVLFNRCAADLDFLQLVCNAMRRLVKKHKKINPGVLQTAIGFYTTTLIGTIRECKKVKDTIVALVLPSVIQGLRSGLEDYVAGVYMVLAQLCRQTRLKTTFIDQLIQRIVMNLHPSLMEEAVALLCLLCQSQDFSVFPPDTLPVLLDTEGIPKALEAISADFSVGPLLISLLTSIDLAADDGTHVQALARLVQSSRLPQHNAQTFIEKVLHCSGLAVKSMSDSTITAVKELLVSCEKRHPEAFDAAVTHCATPAHNVVLGRETVVRGDPNAQTDWFLRLHHPEATLRGEAVNRLIRAIRQGKVEEEGFVSRSLLSCLRDEEPLIVEKVLVMGELLLKFLETATLLDEMKRLSCLHLRDRTWRVVSLKAVVLAMEHLSLDSLVFVLPFLLPAKEKHLSFIRPILDTPFAQKHPLLRGLSECISGVTELEKALWKILGQLAMNLSEMMSSSVDAFGKDVSETPEMHLQHLGILVLSRTVTALQVDQDDLLTLMQAMLNCLSPILLSMVIPSQGNEMSAWSKAWEVSGRTLMWTIKHSQRGSISEMLLHIALSSIAHALDARRPEQPDLEGVVTESCTPETKWLSIYLQLLHRVVSLQAAKPESQLWRDAVSTVLKVGGGGPQQLQVLSLCWAADELCPNSGFHFHIPKSLKVIALRILSQLDAGVSSSALLASLLASLTSQAAIREAALACLQLLSKRLSENDPLKSLIGALLAKGSEIEGDPSHAAEVVALQASFANVEGSPSKRTRKKDPKEALDALLSIVTDERAPLLMQIRIGLLHLLSSVHSKPILERLLPLLRQVLSKRPSPEEPEKWVLGVQESQLVKLITSRFCAPPVASFLDGDLLEEFHCLLRDSVTYLTGTQAGTESLARYLVSQLDDEFFGALSGEEIQLRVVSTLIDVTVQPGLPEVVLEVKKVLNKLPLCASLVTQELRRLSQLDILVDAPQKRARRIQSRLSRTMELKAIPETEASPSTNLNWRQKLTLFLEVLRSNKKIQDFHKLLSPLFGVLQKSLEWLHPGDQDEEVNSVEYIQDLLLSCIHAAVNALMGNKDKTDLSPESFHVELVVQVVRNAHNPQVFHQAFLLLSTAAELFPKKVLENMMGIFTFMGSTVLHFDDAYSFQVINRAIESIIPAALQSEKSQVAAAGILRVFVGAVADIPVHRRISIFTKLIETLNPEHSVWLLLLIFIEAHVLKESSSLSEVRVVEGPDVGRSDSLQLPWTFELALKVVTSQAPQCQLDAVAQCLHFLLSHPMEPEKSAFLPSTPMRSPARKRVRQDSFSKTLKQDTIINLDQFTPKQFRHFQFASLKLLSALFATEGPITQGLRVRSPRQVEKYNEEMSRTFRNFLEALLKWIDAAGQGLASGSSDPASSRFWKAIVQKSCELLDKVTNLLPKDEFLPVVLPLLSHQQPFIRQKILEVLSIHLARPEFLESPGDVGPLLLALRPLVEPRKKGTRKRKEGEEEDVSIIPQLALYALRLLCRLAGSQDLEFHQFVPVLNKMIEGGESIHPAVLGSALLCVAEIIRSAHLLFIPHINTLIPALLGILDSFTHRPAIQKTDLVLMSALAVVQRACIHIPAFLSPHLPDILFHVCILMGHAQGEDKKEDKGHRTSSDNPPSLSGRLKGICDSLCGPTMTGKLIPAIEGCYDRLKERGGSKPMAVLLGMLSVHLNSLDKIRIADNLQELTRFFIKESVPLKVLNYRSETGAEPSCEEVEGSAIEAFLALLLKLSEQTFRPLFFRLYDWATRPDAPPLRILTFYRLTDRMADCLKSLFVLFAGTFLKHAAGVLAKTKNAESLYFEDVSDPGGLTDRLLTVVVDTLSKVFVHDHEQFINEDRFNILLQPLTDQVEALFFSGKKEQDDVPSLSAETTNEEAVYVAGKKSYSVRLRKLIKR